jgi:hypothetical protein
MAEEKKRFPWWLPACSVLLVIFAVALGFVETVGRQGTIVGRFNRLEMYMSEAEVRAILGPGDVNGVDSGWEASFWHEGPVEVRAHWASPPAEAESV